MKSEAVDSVPPRGGPLARSQRPADKTIETIDAQPDREPPWGWSDSTSS
jgi:hypothetical protein